MHGFVGGALLGGPAIAAGSGSGLRGSGFGSAFGSILFALRGGVIIDRHELTLEVSPMTFAFGGNLVPAFQVNGAYGYLIPLSTSGSPAIYWPLRLGIGLLTDLPTPRWAVQARADFLGIALRFDQFLLDLHLPSVRYAGFPGRFGIHILFWEAGVSASYVF